MPTKRISFGDGYATITYQLDWKPGDQPPSDSDYLGWQEWARVQYKSGLRQVRCDGCGKWRFPQEMSDVRRKHTLYSDRGMTKPVQVETRACNKCIATVNAARSRESKVTMQSVTHLGRRR